MGAVILTILKIIGITLAVLVGLILLIVLLVGFVPVRYKASAEYPAEGTLKADVISQRKREALKNKVKTVDLEEGEAPEKEKKHLEIKADAVVSWLLHIVHVRYSLDSTGSIMTVRLFGLFKIYSNDPESVRKKEEKKRKKEEKRKKKEEKQRRKEEKKAAKEKPQKDSSKENKPVETEEVKALEAEPEKAENQETDAKVREPEEKKTREEKTGSLESEDSVKKEASETDKDKAASDDFDAFDDDDELDDEEPKEKKGIVGKIKGIYGKISSIFKKIKYVKDMKDDERVRSGLSYGKKKLFLIIKRVLPKKVKGRVAFGMDDPATTGYIMGGACLFYRHWRGHFLLEPDFEKKRLEADVNLKGRIVLAMLVIPAVKVWFNKDIKHIRRRVGKLKKM